MYGRSHRFRGKAGLSRRGRATIVVLLLVWGATQAGLSFAANVLWPGLRNPLYFDKYAKYRLRLDAAAGRPVNVVMFGSSRPLCALDCRSLDAQLTERIGRPVLTFNYGMPACGPITNYLNLRRFLISGERPAVVLIEVLPPLMAAQHPVPIEHRFLFAERLLADEVAPVTGYGFPEGETGHRWWRSSLAPVYGLRFPILGRLAPKWLPWSLRFDGSRIADSAGWIRSMSEAVSPEEYRWGVERTRVEYRDMFQGLRFDGAAARALRDSLAICRDHGVPAALVLMPESSEFRSWYSPAMLEELSDLLGSLSREFGVPLIDARRWLGDGSFTDGHHVLPSGAAAFTHRLGCELPALLGTGQ